MWEVVFATDDNEKPLGKSRFDFYRKNQPRAFVKLFDRLQKVLERLNVGLPANVALSYGWVHPEGKGVFAIDPVPGHQALRLYCALRPEHEQIIVYSIGEKKRQQSDLADVHEWNATY